MAATIVEIFQALANPDRLALLDRLRQTPHGKASVTELAELAGISRFAASHHLSVLRSVGLLNMSEETHRRVHRLNLETLRSVEDWLYDFDDR